MQISLSPQRGDDSLTVVRSEQTLTINDTAYDFSVLANGDILPPDGHDCPHIVGDVTRDGSGELHITLRLPISADASAAATNPAVIDNPANGPVSLPG